MKQCLGSVLNGRARRECGCAQQHEEARRAGERLHRLCGSEGRKVRNAECAEEGARGGWACGTDDVQGTCARRGAVGARSYRLWWRGGGLEVGKRDAFDCRRAPEQLKVRHTHS